MISSLDLSDYASFIDLPHQSIPALVRVQDNKALARPVAYESSPPSIDPNFAHLAFAIASPIIKARVTSN